ncbi:hypothetical protein [Nonomuraea wenchangensis]|uniref:Uncharacterized protein n=1 Tax=Nonomuraea wenchangensis TaxID=568860 RepID=A0A1I0KPI9_9ACTN|nr:hypothetical protein [Nonomuraea wenchangensis]SEU27568.1 hypothetical protein SAMN05421811_10942 [Nonomuraea wenchangensis]
MVVSFRDKLLQELRAEAATVVSWESRPAPRPTTRRLVAAAGLAAAVVAVVMVAVPLVSETPAFAVVRNPDGTVTVRINEFVRPKELERRLREEGVRAVIDYVPYGQTCREPRGEIVPQPQRMPLRRLDGPDFWIDPKDFGPDETLVVVMHSADGDPAKSNGGSVGVIRGAVAPCELVPAEFGGVDRE